MKRCQWCECDTCLNVTVNAFMYSLYNSSQSRCPIFNPQVDQFIHRILAEEDAKNSEERNEELFQASADVGEKLYTKGDFAKSQISKLDFYLLRKVPKKILYCTLFTPLPPLFSFNKWFPFRLVYFQMSWSAK